MTKTGRDGAEHMTASLEDENAELRRANAELRQQRDEALAREAATAEVLQVINSSPGDLTPVFEAILEKAHSLCGAEYGVLLTYDGELFWPVAFHGLSTQLTDARLEGIDPNVAPSFGRIVRGLRLVSAWNSVACDGDRGKA